MNKCLKRGNIIIWKERDGTINYGKVWKYVDDGRSYDYVWAFWSQNLKKCKAHIFDETISNLQQIDEESITLMHSLPECFKKVIQ